MIVKIKTSAIGRTPMPQKSNRKTRVRNRRKSGSPYVLLSASENVLANLIGGFPATVRGSPGRDHSCRRNWISLAGVETPSRKFEGKLPYSATELLPLKKLRGKSSWRSVRCSPP